MGLPIPSLRDWSHEIAVIPSIHLMKMPQKLTFLFVAVLALPAAFVGCANREEPPAASGYSKTAPPPRVTGERLPAPCTPEWNVLVERKLQISDSSGHGPDLGSQEWMHAVGRRSGVIDAAGHGPDPGSDEWCRAVDYKVFGRR